MACLTRSATTGFAGCRPRNRRAKEAHCAMQTSLSRWQLRKWYQRQARARAADSWNSGSYNQVKSLVSSADFVKEVGIDYVAESFNKLPARKMDCSMQTNQLGIDVKLPNWLPYFDPAEHEAQAGVQTDVMPSSHGRGEGGSDRHSQGAGGCMTHSAARTYLRTDNGLAWVDEFDLVNGEATSSMESVSGTDTEYASKAAQTLWEETDVACQTSDVENKVNSATQTRAELVATMAQTSLKACVLDYGDAIKAVVAVSACGCPARAAQEDKHRLVVIPVGEVGIVKMVYVEKAMVKADFPAVGVMFLTFMDIEHFDCYLNVHLNSDRMKRLENVRAPSETSRSAGPVS